MKQEIKLQFKLFYKNKLLRYLYIGISLISFGGILFFMGNQADTSFLFYVITRFIFYINLLFCIMSYIFMIYAKQNQIEDTILVSSQGVNRYQLSSLIVVMSLLFILNIGIVLLLVVSANIHSQFDILMILKDFYLMNILLPQITSLMITIALSSLKNIYIGSLLLIGFIFLTSPYMEVFQWSEKPAVPIDQIVNFIQLPFAYFLQNSEWSIDYLYGLQNELYKIMAFAFWNLTALLIIIRKNMIKNKIVLTISTLVLFVTAYMIYIPQSMARFNNKWDGFYKDIVDYGIANNGSLYEGQKKEDYRIDRYELDIDIKEKLYVQGKLYITSDKENNQYNLTLYKDYKINSIKSKNLLSYEQKGDYISLQFDKPVSKIELEIKYSGFHYNLYSNYQAVVLPGYFPWYPMVGHQQNYIMFKDSSIANYGYNPYNRVDNANFDISIQANYSILSNLNYIENGKYSAITDSMTIVGGQMVIEKNQRFLNYCPLYLSNELPYEDFQQMRESVFLDINQKIKRIFDITPKFIDKKVICTSNGLSRGLNLGSYAEFKDYLFVSGNGIIDDRNLLNYYIYNSDLDLTLKDCLSMIGLRPESKEEYLDSLLSTLQEFMDQSKMSDNQVSKEKYIRYEELYKSILNKINNNEIEQYFKDIGKELFQ